MIYTFTHLRIYAFTHSTICLFTNLPIHLTYSSIYPFILTINLFTHSSYLFIFTSSLIPNLVFLSNIAANHGSMSYNIKDFRLVTWSHAGNFLLTLYHYLYQIYQLHPKSFKIVDPKYSKWSNYIFVVPPQGAL
jgi:hypothetical protein